MVGNNMKNKQPFHGTLRRFVASLSLGLLAAFSLILPVYADSGSIYIVANKSTVVNGSTVIVAVYMNGGGNSVNAVQTNLSYPTDKLQYVGVNYSGSAFDIAAANSGGGGSVSIARGTTGAVTGVGLVATVTFKASAVGAASVDIAGGSALAANGGEVAAGTSGVHFSIVAPSITSAPAARSTASPVVASPVAKDTTPPVITAIKATNLSPSTATITWTTDKPSDTVVEYGLDTSYGLSTSVATQTTKHQSALNSSFLVPMTSIHYRVKSTDAAGNIQTSPDQTVGIPGIPVSVIVRGSDGKPQVGASVTLDNQTKTTDNTGTATFQSGVGNKQIVTSYAGTTIKRSITVSNSSKPLPPFELSLAARPADLWMIVSAGLAIALFVLLLLDAYLFGSKFLSRLILARIPKKRLEAISPVAAAGPPALATHEAPTHAKPKLFVHPPATFAATPVANPHVETFRESVPDTTIEARVDSMLKPERSAADLKLKTAVGTSFTLPEQSVPTAPPVVLNHLETKVKKVAGPPVVATHGPKKIPIV
jgi:hypothetical protein